MRAVGGHVIVRDPLTFVDVADDELLDDVPGSLSGVTKRVSAVRSGGRERPKNLRGTYEGGEGLVARPTMHYDDQSPTKPESVLFQYL